MMAACTCKHCVANTARTMLRKITQAGEPARRGKPSFVQTASLMPCRAPHGSRPAPTAPGAARCAGSALHRASHGQYNTFPGHPQRRNRCPAAQPQISPAPANTALDGASSSLQQESIWAAGNVVPSRSGFSPSWTKTNRAEIPSKLCFSQTETQHFLNKPCPLQDLTAA